MWLRGPQAGEEIVLVGRDLLPGPRRPPTRAPRPPRGRPASVRRWDLRKAACLRAFLGQPILIILEQPVRGVYADLMAPLINSVQSARNRGATVLWTVTDPQIWNQPGIHATKRARMFGSQLHAMDTVS